MKLANEIICSILALALTLTAVGYAREIFCTVRYQSKVLTSAVSEVYSRHRGNYHDCWTKDDQRSSAVERCK